MYPKAYIPILWLLSHVVLPVFVFITTVVFIILFTVLHEYVTEHIRIIFQIL